jgi:RNA polymerase sigma factor (sigma-70 family)
LRAAMERLPDKERAALLLREVEGLETEEVAARMGSTAVTVRSQISRARARLRAWMGGAR